MESSARLKRWMTLVALAGLLAGIPLGVALHQAYQEEDGADTEFLIQFRERYGLRSSQVRTLRRILSERDREISAFLKSLSAQLPPKTQEKLAAIRRKADERIVAVLDSDQRERYRKHLQANSAASK